MEFKQVRILRLQALPYPGYAAAFAAGSHNQESERESPEGMRKARRTGASYIESQGSGTQLLSSGPKNQTYPSPS